MRILLDTHTLIWWFEGSSRLLPSTVELIADARATVVVSVATVWEIEIKRALGTLTAPDDVLAQVAASGFDLLPINGEHAVAAARLPRHHDDPFDRLLIAQAIAEGLTVVTRDHRFADYGVRLIPS